jgi:hypothetical protein
MDLSSFLPQDKMEQIKALSPNDLDSMGPPKLLYYDSGINFYKNIITGFISCLTIFMVNFTIYFIMKRLPFVLTNKLAKKISLRKIILIHDTF